MRPGRRRACEKAAGAQTSASADAPSVLRGTTVAEAPAVRPSRAGRDHAVPQGTWPVPQEERPSARLRLETAHPPAAKAEPWAAPTGTPPGAPTQASNAACHGPCRPVGWQAGPESWGDSSSPHVLRIAGPAVGHTAVDRIVPGGCRRESTRRCRPNSVSLIASR